MKDAREVPMRDLPPELPGGIYIIFTQYEWSIGKTLAEAKANHAGTINNNVRHLVQLYGPETTELEVDQYGRVSHYGPSYIAVAKVHGRAVA